MLLLYSSRRRAKIPSLWEKSCSRFGVRPLNTARCTQAHTHSSHGRAPVTQVYAYIFYTDITCPLAVIHMTIQRFFLKGILKIRESPKSDLKVLPPRESLSAPYRHITPSRAGFMSRVLECCFVFQWRLFHYLILLLRFLFQYWLLVWFIAFNFQEAFVGLIHGGLALCNGRYWFEDINRASIGLLFLSFSPHLSKYIPKITDQLEKSDKQPGYILHPLTP